MDRVDNWGYKNDQLANAAWWRLLSMEYMALCKLRKEQNTPKPSPDTNNDDNDRKDDKNDKNNKDNNDRKDENNEKKRPKSDGGDNNRKRIKSQTTSDSTTMKKASKN